MRFCITLIWLLLASSTYVLSAPPKPTGTVYQDVFLRETPQTWQFGNRQLTLTVNKQTGAWTELTTRTIPGKLLTAQTVAQTMDFQIDTVRMIETHGATLLRQTVSINRLRHSVTWELTFGVLPQNQQPGRYTYELSCRYVLFPDSAQLTRTARLVYQQGSSPVKMRGFTFKLPHMVIGKAANCMVDVPGPFFPKTFLKPETPLKDLSGKSIRFHSAPDAGLGILAISNPSLPQTLITWMETSGEVAYEPALQSDGNHVDFRLHNDRSYWMTAGFAVESDVQYVGLAPSLPNALAGYRRMCEQQMPMDTQTPDAMREMVLLEVYPQYYKEGFKGITKKLPFYKEVGFNTLYLMPHWKGGYSPIDFYVIDSTFGTAAELKEMIRTAHELGMRVFFDMVIHGFNEKSPVIKQRPELFVHDETGKPALHPTWKSVTTDWASPAYQQYMADLARHHVQTYDMDGYRLDAASYKGPSWDTTLAYPAYRSGSAAPELMNAMLDAMRETKPEAVMLSEVFGPVFYTVSNLVHDNQTEAAQFIIEKMEQGKYTARDYQLHLRNVLAALPKGANRVYFARNHDTSWFYHFNGYTPRFMALEAIHALCVIPEVFAGDPKNKPNPDDDLKVFEQYKKLFTLRKDFPELSKGELVFDGVESDNPMVFTAVKRYNGKHILITVSLSDKAESVKIEVNKKAAGKLSLMDGLTRKPVSSTQAGDAVNVQLQPFQVVVGSGL